MEIVNRLLDELKPYQNNPRLNDGAVEAVAASIQEFGFKVPMLISADNEIICGHTRYKAAQLLQFETIPCIIAGDLTDKQIRAYRLIDNKTAELSTWDDEKLYEELNALQELDMSQFGFEVISEDMFNNDFSLPDGEKSTIQNVSFSLADEQAELIFDAMEQVKDEIRETFGNENTNGNRLYEVVRQWAELKKS